MLTLHNLKSNKRKKRRLGRGNASGNGNYSGRGMKGQKARSGGKIRRGFEGGQTPWYKKTPKYKGMRRRYSKYLAVNFDLLNKYFQEEEIVSPQTLLKKKVIKNLSKHRGIKILAEGQIKIKDLKFEGCKFSTTAKKILFQSSKKKR